MGLILSFELCILTDSPERKDGSIARFSLLLSLLGKDRAGFRERRDDSITPDDLLLSLRLLSVVGSLEQRDDSAIPVCAPGGLRGERKETARLVRVFYLLTLPQAETAPQIGEALSLR